MENRSYEAMAIISPDLEDEKIDETIEKFKGIIEKKKGKMIGVDKWGRRKLMYKIQGFLEGSYIIFYFTGKSDTVQELGRVFRISDEVIRHIIIRNERIKQESIEKGEEKSG